MFNWSPCKTRQSLVHWSLCCPTSAINVVFKNDSLFRNLSSLFLFSSNLFSLFFVSLSERPSLSEIVVISNLPGRNWWNLWMNYTLSAEWQHCNKVKCVSKSIKLTQPYCTWSTWSTPCATYALQQASPQQRRLTSRISGTSAFRSAWKASSVTLGSVSLRLLTSVSLLCLGR